MKHWRPASRPVFPHQEERAILFVLLVAVSAAVSACSQDARAAVQREPAARIVSLLPSATEVLVAIGAADRLIARTDYDTDARLRGLPSLGRSLDPTAEAVLSLQPDLVILPAFVQPRHQLMAVLSRQGVPMVVPQVRTLREVYQLIDTIGALVDRREPARALRETIRSRLDQLKSEAPAVSPTVLYVLWHTPPVVAGPGSHVAELIGIAGGRNLVTSPRAPWPELSLEELLQRNPDLLVVPTRRGGFDAAALRRLSGWRELAAVKHGRIIEVDADLFDRPGPRVAEAAALLAQRLRREAVRP